MVSIYNSMSDRRHEIAVIRALGAKRRTVMLIVLLESILLALGGGLIGLVLGHGLTWVLSGTIEDQTGVAVNPLQFQLTESDTSTGADPLGLGRRIHARRGRLSDRRGPVVDFVTLTMSTESRFPKTQPIISGRLLRLLARSERAEGGYQAVCGLAVWCLLFGAASGLAFLHWSLDFIPVAAIVVGWFALGRIRSNPQEMSGTAIAWTGMGLAAAFWVLGSGWLVYQAQNWVPPGYKLINYSLLQPAADDIEHKIPHDAIELDRQKVFIRGFMLPTKRQVGLKEFTLSEDQGDCAYCKPIPKTTQMIKVKMKAPQKANFTTRAIGVGGEMTVIEDPRDPKRAEMDGLIYQIEADYIQ